MPTGWPEKTWDEILKMDLETKGLDKHVAAIKWFKLILYTQLTFQNKNVNEWSQKFYYFNVMKTWVVAFTR